MPSAKSCNLCSHSLILYYELLNLQQLLYTLQLSCKPQLAKKIVSFRSIPCNSNIIIMLSFTVGTVLFFARTAVIESAGQNQPASSTFTTPTRPGDRWEIQITDDTLEWLKKTKTIASVAGGHSNDFESATYRPVEAPVRPDDKTTELALGAWATAILNQDFAHQDDSRPGSTRDTRPIKVYSQSIDYMHRHHPQEMRQLGTPIIWRAVEKHEVDSYRLSLPSSSSSSAFHRWLTNGVQQDRSRDTLHEEDTYARHLIIRQIGPNLREWMEVIQRTHVKGRPRHCQHVFLIQLDQHRVDQLRFLTSENDEKRLTDISDLFAHQRKMDLERIISEISLRNPSGIKFQAEEQRSQRDLQSAQSRLQEIIQREEVEQMISEESYERNAIQRDGIEGIHAMAISKESMRWQLEIQKMKNEYDAKERRQQQEIARFQTDNFRDLQEMEKKYDSQKKEWHEDKERLKRMKDQLEKRQSEIDNLHKKQTKLTESWAHEKEELKQEVQFLKEHNTQSQSEDDFTAGLKLENKDLQSQLEILKSEIASVKQHEKKLGQHAEDESKLKEEIADLRNDVAVAQTALDQAEDALKQATDDRRKREEELEPELDAERERLKTEKEKEKHDQMMVFVYVGGGSLVVFAIFIAVWRWRANKKASDDMDQALNAQLKRVKEPHPLVPEYPSAHANRLGVHEHPAVRDVFGMKEPWDVTPGEGFHVARITKGEETPGTPREGTDEGDVTITIVGDPMNDPESADVVEEDEGVNVG